MVEFLGRMLRVPPHLRPLNFDISSKDADTGRFSVDYQGQQYVVHDRRHRIDDPLGCHDGPGNPGCEDHTLEILTLVNQLIDLHKNGGELPSTGAVQVVN